MKRGTKIGWILVALSVALSIFVLSSRGSKADEVDGFIIEDGVAVQYTGAGGTVTVPTGVTSLAGGIFASNTNISSVNLNQVENIGSDAFAGCSNLSSVNFGNTKTIGSGAFQNCSSLSSLSLGGVQTIGANAFSGCNGLTSVSIPSSTSNVSTSAFDYCGNLTSISASSGSYRSGDGCLYNGAGTRLLIVPEGKSSVTIAGNCTSIGDNAFSYCDNIDEVTIPASVTSIGSQTGWSPSTIYGYADTAAEEYTYGKNIVFIAVDAGNDPDPGSGTDPQPNPGPGVDPVGDTCVVTFDANGHGTAPSPVTVAKGSLLPTPAALTAPGFVFGGWYKDAACTSAWSQANETVNSNITLYAKWTPVPAGTHTVTYDVQGIGTAPAAQSVQHGALVTAPTAPSAQGYAFGGWYRDRECTQAWDFATTLLTGDVTLYAKWTDAATGQQVVVDPTTGKVINGQSGQAISGGRSGSTGRSGGHSGSSNGSTGSTHELDQTPTTADGDIDPRFVVIFLVFLMGVGLVIYGRFSRLQYMASRRNRR